MRSAQTSAYVSDPGSFARSADRYRWVTVWLAMGAAIALLLSANAVRDYLFVSRVLATQQVRRQMAQLAAQVEQQARAAEIKPHLLEGVLSDTLRGDEAINLRDIDGALLDHAGKEFPAAVFPLEQERAAFIRHEPLVRIVPTSAGELVVEVFPLHPGRRAGPPPDRSAPPPDRTSPDRSALDRSPRDRTQPGGQRPMLLEMALPLKDADPTVLTPIRRNLFINLVAALSLLATVLLARIGLQSYLRGLRLEEQVEIARQVQSRLLPEPGLELPGCQIATEYKPSEQVGGDFYDVFPLASNGFGAVIGDVSGKGLPAALLMGVIHGAVRTAAWWSAAGEHEDESRRLNRLLCEHASDSRFASMFWCVYDPALRSLRYVNAGHCPPFLIGGGGATGEFVRLRDGGPVFGLLPQATYAATTVEVAPGDLLILYSDGLVEAASAAGAEYGEDRLAELLRRHSGQTPAEIREAILESLKAFSPAGPAQDDLTFVLLRF
jgi:serine phosphatase RsbU (regulator of sigma subunit)